MYCTMDGGRDSMSAGVRARNSAGVPSFRLLIRLTCLHPPRAVPAGLPGKGPVNFSCSLAATERRSYCGD